MSLKILLADAGDILKSVLELSEEDLDIKVIYVPSGTDALLRIKEIRPDVLVADVALPGVDGYSLCEIVRTEGDLSEMRSVLTGEEGAEVDESRVEAAASDGFLPKPFNAEKLLRHLGLAEETGDVEEDDENAEAMFQMHVSDDMSFADVALNEGQADEELVMGEDDIREDAPASDVEEQKTESLDGLQGRGDESTDNVDVDLGGDEDQAERDSVEPFAAQEPAEINERGTLLSSDETENVSSGSTSDISSEEGRKLIEEIVKRLSDKVVREVAWDVVPEIAERIIKETLEKITK